jgi:hypothetical protein
VGYWAKKHGLTANGRGKHSARGGLSKAELQPLVEAGLTLREIAKVFDRSLATVRYWIDRHGPPRCREVRRSEIEAAVKSGNRTVMRRCRSHVVTEFALVGSANRPGCKRCRSEAVARRRRKVKQTLVDEAGGKCVLCGYDRSVNALEFHHVDPSQKSFGVARRGITRSIDQVREEVAKCVLLCANCHAEVEGGSLALLS